jgi:hypothetical protein
MHFVICLLAIGTLLNVQQSAPAAAANPQASSQSTSTEKLTDEKRPPVTVPAGTRIPLRLRMPILTNLAYAGETTYFETAFPVVQDNKIVIPAGSQVTGVIESLKRPGRFHGRAEIMLHFTTLRFPNGYVISFPGSVAGAPDNDSAKMKNDEGALQAPGHTKKVVTRAAAGGGTGAATGAIFGGGPGAGLGAGAGTAAGIVTGLLTMDRQLKLDAGTVVGMELQRPLTFEPQLPVQ